MSRKPLNWNTILSSYSSLMHWNIGLTTLNMGHVMVRFLGNAYKQMSSNQKTVWKGVRHCVWEIYTYVCFAHDLPHDSIVSMLKVLRFLVVLVEGPGWTVEHTDTSRYQNTWSRTGYPSENSIYFSKLDSFQIVTARENRILFKSWISQNVPLSRKVPFPRLHLKQSSSF
jgi:hypothetical protein